ncbi:MAG: hypothetical protein IE925_05895 [Rhodobacterales bacterium]|nr:hypothetical protein [Rhodobacterales bacterium]
MNYTPKRWIRLGLGAALIGTAGLAACGGEGGEAGETGAAALSAPGGAAASGEGGEMGEGEGGEGVTALDPALLLPIDERAVLISSQVAAAGALARMGQTSDAAEHLRLAVSEIKPGGLSRLVENGFDPDLFETAADKLASGAPPEEAEAGLVAVEANAAALEETAAGEPVPLIALLIKRCQNAYQSGVSLNNQIEDPIAYQDAYGYAVTAQRLAGTLEGEDASGLQLELRMLVLMWPAEGPVSGDLPAPPMTFLSQLSRVQQELSALQ